VSEPLLHRPGIYFDLDEAVYHADPALGSSDLKKLAVEPADYWWHSRYNPARSADNDTPAKALGRAVHYAALFGIPQFRKRYGRCQFIGSVKAGKEERDRFASLGMEPMRGEDYDRVLAAGTMVRANPEIADAFKGGAAEVSIFWEEDVDGEIVRRKARFDYLRPTAIVDLKSHTPSDGMGFYTSCLAAMKRYRYWIQSTAYLQALPYARQFAKDGQVTGDADLARHLLASEDHVFSFVFWASEGSPLTDGLIISKQNGLYEIGVPIVAKALWNFVDYRREFGTERAWIRAKPLREVSPEEVFEYWRNDTA
jgi:hypothetical protein